MSRKLIKSFNQFQWCLEGAKMFLVHVFPCIGGDMAHKAVGLISPDPARHRGPILTPKIAAFGPLQALDECLEGAKMVLVHVFPCIGG